MLNALPRSVISPPRLLLRPAFTIMRQQNFYALLNAHALAQFCGFSLNMWAKNLTNTKYCTFAIDSSASGEKHYFGQKGMPVMVGVDVNVNF